MTRSEPGGQNQISGDGGREPVWSPDGDVLYYRTSEQLIAVDILPGSTFTVGGKRQLFEDTNARVNAHANYDVHPDGDRFVMVKQSVRQPELTVVLNFFEELKAKVGN